MTPPVPKTPTADFENPARMISLSFKSENASSSQSDLEGPIAVSIDDTVNVKSPFPQTARNFSVQFDGDTPAEKITKTSTVTAKTRDEYIEARERVYQDMSRECRGKFIRILDSADTPSRDGSGVLSGNLSVECLISRQRDPVVNSGEVSPLTGVERGLMITLASREKRRALEFINSLDGTLADFQRSLILYKRTPDRLNTDGSLSIQWKDLVLSPHRPVVNGDATRRKYFEAQPSGILTQANYDVSCSEIVKGDGGAKTSTCEAVDIKYSMIQDGLTNYFNYHVKRSSNRLSRTFQYFNRLLSEGLIPSS